MSKLRNKILSPLVALLICSNMYADNIAYSIEKQSLKNAIEIISKKANIPYIVQGKLLKGKKSHNIKNITGTKNALKELLKGTGLEAIVEDGAIIIKKKILKKEGSSNLGVVDIIENSSNLSEGSGLYTVESMNTSTKLNLSPRETPQSIVVLTNQKMQDENMQTFRDISDNVVGFNSSDWDTDRLYINSRGFTVDYYQIDGIPSSYDAYASEQNLIMYDRVEIVRGANGLMTGAGNPAASINLIRKHANSKEFIGNVKLQAGTWNEYNATVDVSSAVNEEGTIRARVLAQHKESDSFRNLFSKESNSFYGIIDADLNDQTSVFAGASYQHSNTDGTSWGGLPVFFSDGSLTNFDVSANLVPDWSNIERKTTNIFTGLEHSFLNDIKIKANYSYLEVDADFKIAQFGTYPNKITGDGLVYAWDIYNANTKNKKHVLDIYTSIPFELGNQNHEVVIGATYSKNKYSAYRADQKTSPIPQNIYHWNGNIEEPEYNESTQDMDKITTQSGIYLVGKFNLLDDLKLITGARVTNWKYEDKFNSKGYKYDNIITPYLGLVYDVNPNHSIYSSYTNIFKAQDKRNIKGELLNPIEGNSYEMGIKGEYFDKRLTSALTYYVINKDNVAKTDGINIPGTNNEDAYYEVDGVTSKGYELSISGKITDEWDVDMGYTNFSLKDAEGNKDSTTIPRKQFSLSTKYKVNKIVLGAGIKWQDKFYADVLNPSDIDQKVTQEAFYLVTAMARYDFSKKLSMQLNINNLFNKKYYTNISFPWDGGSYFHGEPRKTTLTLNYKF